jgi:hypothetical protein
MSAAPTWPMSNIVPGVAADVNHYEEYVSLQEHQSLKEKVVQLTETVLRLEDAFTNFTQKLAPSHGPERTVGTKATQSHQNRNKDLEVSGSDCKWRVVISSPKYRTPSMPQCWARSASQLTRRRRTPYQSRYPPTPVLYRPRILAGGGLVGTWHQAMHMIHYTTFTCTRSSSTTRVIDSEGLHPAPPAKLTCLELAVCRPSATRGR